MAFATVSRIGLAPRRRRLNPFHMRCSILFTFSFLFFFSVPTVVPVKMPGNNSKRTSLHIGMSPGSVWRTNANIWHYRVCDCKIYVWLNHGPTAPFMCPLLWIPTPFEISGGNPTAIGGGAAGYIPWLWGKVWGLTWGLAGLPLRCWRTWICLRPSSWIRDIVSNSCIDRASNPAP